MALLDIEDLCVEFGSETRPFRAVDHVSLTLARGEVLGIVGESGSGKSVTSLALMGLIDFPGRVRAQRLCFDGEDLLSLPERERRSLTGKDMAMVFQDPMGGLDPCYTVGFQIMETLAVHEGGSRRARRQRARELLESVGIPDPSSRLDAYPHQLSGGMSQRVMIALAIACNPSLLIADEPTTALDVTIQAQILDLLGELQTRNRMGMLLITHDLAVVAGSCSRVLVMYAGQVVESGTVGAVFATPLHPYTAALLAALPERAEPGARRLYALPGVVPGQYDRRDGCLLAPRCPHARPHCHAVAPALATAADGRAVRCHTPLDATGRPHGAVA